MSPRYMQTPNYFPPPHTCLVLSCLVAADINGHASPWAARPAHHTHTHTHTRACTHTHTYARMHTHTHVCMHAHAHTHTCIPLGTDATHAEHIETIKTRNYVGVQSDGSLVPGELGMGLVEGERRQGILD